MRARNLPPIEGMPAERPVCAGCAKKLTPHIEFTWGTGETQGVVLRRRFLRWDCYAGIFHSLRCGMQFGARAYAAGYRLKGTGK